MQSLHSHPGKISFFVLLLIFGLHDCYAVKENIRFQRLSSKEGLSQNTVRDILQDRRGFLWIATQDGLNRYDGYTFYKYRHKPEDTNSLSNNLVFCLAEDHHGVLWVGTWTGGLDKLDPATDRISHYRHHPQDPSSLSDNDVSVISPSLMEAHTLWVGTFNGGLNKFDISTGKSVRYQHQDGNINSLCSDQITDICEDPPGTLWIATRNGLDRFDPNLLVFQHVLSSTDRAADKKGVMVNCLQPDLQDRLWIGTEEGLHVLQRKTNSVTAYRTIAGDPNSLSDNRVKSICLDSLGYLWIATWNGLDRFDQSQNSFLRFYNEPANPYSLSYNAFYSLYTDRSGILWIGSYSQGLNKYDRNQNKFMLYRNDPNDPNSLNCNIVKALYEDRDRILWIGTYFGGLNRLDRKTGQFSHFLHHPQNPASLSSNSVISVFEDRSGVLWVATTDRGLNIFDRRSGAFRCYRHNPQDRNSLSGDFVNSIFEDSQDRLWVGTNNGLNRFDRATGRFISFVHDPKDALSLSNNRVKIIFEDAEKNIWLVTDKGINRFDPEHGTCVRYSHQQGQANGPSHDVAVSIYESPRQPGILWIATYGGGLNRFDVKAGQFTCYREKDGLPNDMVYGILEDQEGHFWISTNSGLCKFDPNSGTFRSFDASDGVQGDEFNLALCKGYDGMMFFGGMDGFNAFYPEHIKEDEHIPPVVITDLKIFNKSVPIGKSPDGRMILQSDISRTDQIQLSYRDFVFSFEFAALAFSMPEKCMYAYMMEGVDKEWIKTDASRRHATYTNLAGGRYLFKVKGANSDGIWNEKPTTLAVIIKPPFWQTTWFRIAGLLLALCLLMSVYRNRTKSIEQQNKKLEQLVAERTEDLRRQTQELETLDKIVNLINRELVLERVFNSLLRQGIKLQPKANKAVLLIYDQNLGRFKFAAVSGYDPQTFHSLTFTREEILDRYSSGSKEVEKNIFVITDFASIDQNEKLKLLPAAHSIIVMVISLHGRLEGFMVLENPSPDNPFDASDAHRLLRFRSHAISAIAKAKMLQDLQDKNIEIVKAQEQLVTQQKLAFLGTLTAGIAHEIKNPLNFVNNFAELSIELLQELELEVQGVGELMPPDKVAEIHHVLQTLKDNAAKIQEHGKRADGIVRSMLQHSRGKSGERQVTDINAMLEEDINLAYHGMRAQDSSFNIKIEKELDPDIEPIEVVPQNISRVFLNIITNGCYEAHKKRLERGSSFAPTILIKSRDVESMIEIRIRDNGNGIAPAIRDKLFTPFFTTKPAGKGTGLGLSISYDIVVHEHKGQIKFETQEGEYTEFIIRLPKSLS
jgi:ligand-binding sensor domain-containing protein/signal transduction histidine kinase